MSLNELILNQPKPWLPIRIWNCIIDNVFTLLPNAASGRLLRSDAGGNGTWQDPSTFSVTSIASDASVTVNGVASASATTGAITLTATGAFGSRNISTSGTITAPSSVATSASGSVSSGTGGLSTTGNLTAGSSGSTHVLTGNLQISQYLVQLPSVTLFSNPVTTSTISATITAGQLVGGVLIGTSPGGAIIFTTDTAANIKTQIQSTGLSLFVNETFMFWVINNSAVGGSTIQLQGGTGVTVNVAAAAVAQVLGAAGGSRFPCWCVCTNASTPTFTIYS